MTPDGLRQAVPLFDDFIARFAPLLGLESRVERAQAYLRGLLLDNDDNKTAKAIALKIHGEVPKDTRFWLECPAVQLPGQGPKGRSRKKPRVAPSVSKPLCAEGIAASLPAKA